MSLTASQIAESTSTGTARTNGNAWSYLLPVHPRGSHRGTQSTLVGFLKREGGGDTLGLTAVTL
jgi:hypothetical protein